MAGTRPFGRDVARLFSAEALDVFCLHDALLIDDRNEAAFYGLQATLISFYGKA